MVLTVKEQKLQEENKSVGFFHPFD